MQKALVFVSSYAQEGYDRRSLDVSAMRCRFTDEKVDRNGNELINHVANRCNDTIVVVNSVGQIDMSTWINHPNVTGVLFAYLPGMYGGDSLVPILFGDESPSGHLPFTIAKTVTDYDGGTLYNDTSAEGIVSPFTVFSEGSLIDYRYFDKNDIEPEFEFGFGLSYTTFDMYDIRVESNHIPDIAYVRETNEVFLNGTALGQGLYDQSHEVYVSITNTGDMDAKAVVQLYVSFPDSSDTSVPVRVLKGFEKILVKKGQTVTQRISVRNKDLSSWSTESQGWYIQNGEFTFSAGSSSRDLPLEHKMYM